MDPMRHSDELESQTEKIPLKETLLSVRDVNSPKGFLDYVQGTFYALSRTIGFLIAVALGSIIPIAMLIVGAVNKDNCPIQPYIAIYMIVAGAFGIAKSALSVLNQVRLRRLRQKAKDPQATFKGCDLLSSLDSLITWFLFAWFIAGCVWVFGNVFPEFSDTNSPRYCNQALYLFAFAILIIAWILLFILISVFCCCCMLCCAAACGIAVLSSTATTTTQNEPSE